MKFARLVFTVAGIWGMLLLTPLYFMFDLIGQQDPPAITHPAFFYGFAGLGLAWLLLGGRTGPGSGPECRGRASVSNTIPLDDASPGDYLRIASRPGRSRLNPE